MEREAIKKKRFQERKYFLNEGKNDDEVKEIIPT
jgi:hypothetical protein